MDKTFYTCTRAEKTVEEDNFAEGCLPDTHRCLFSERVDIADRNSLHELIADIGEAYDLNIDDIFIPGDDETDIRVINLSGCPRANTMGHCYVETLQGVFLGLVCTHSLQPRRGAK